MEKTFERDLKPGDRIRDNDPRCPSRVLTITALSERYVRAVTALGMESSIQRRFVHTDGKPRRTGFSLVLEGSE